MDIDQRRVEEDKVCPSCSRRYRLIELRRKREDVSADGTLLVMYGWVHAAALYCPFCGAAVPRPIGTDATMIAAENAAMPAAARMTSAPSATIALAAGPC